MSIPITFQSVSYSVPQTDEEGWDNTMTNYLVALAGLDNLSTLIGAAIVAAWKSAATVPGAGATITPTANWHRLAPASAVTLDVTTSVADGTTNGQILILSGTSDTNTVTVVHNSNVQLNGNCVLGANNFLLLIWDSVLGDWAEITRSA